MSFGTGAVAVSLADVLANRVPQSSARPSGETEMICGVFQLRSNPLNPLLSALPRVLKVKTAGPGVSPLLDHAVLCSASRLPRADNFVASRMLEVFFGGHRWEKRGCDGVRLVQGAR
jgi:hypothetical protein